MHLKCYVDLEGMGGCDTCRPLLERQYIAQAQNKHSEEDALAGLKVQV